MDEDYIIDKESLILVTGAAGFIGTRLVQSLLYHGFRNLRCFVRPFPDPARVQSLLGLCRDGAQIEVLEGNLLRPVDCAAAAKGAAVIYHLAAGRGEKSYPDAFINSVVTTRNLLEATIQQKYLRRFVNISSFAVYTNAKKPRWRLLDESCPLEGRPELRGEAYCFAKVKQDEIVTEYGKRFGIPYVILRPGFVYGPGNEPITGRVGIGTFGLFLHLGGSNIIPLTYVDNCADAIALAGLKRGVEGEVFNVVDDDLPSSWRFLHLYKRRVKRFPSLYVPHIMSYLLCSLWERYSKWSQGQLPPAFNRARWHANWKKTYYTNAKLKLCLGWAPRVSTAEGLSRYFEACRNGGHHA
jgi:nucleoside-diphosphate-sugar epimerase